MILVCDDVLPNPDYVLAHAESSGFGNWKPATSASGYATYDGMCFVGRHHELLLELTKVMGTPIFPCTMFFRKTSGKKEECKIHSDREDGSHTAIVYLTEHEGVSGTAFYQHKETGEQEMPPFFEMTEELKADLVDYSKWNQTKFVEGRKNRMVVFDAPLFHSRIQDEDVNDRVVWVCHFYTLEEMQ